MAQDGVYCWLPSSVLDWFDDLDADRLADGPGGAARLELYRNMCAAHDEFPWATVFQDVRRRDYRTKRAREVYFKVHESAKHGFVLRYRICGFQWKPEPSWERPPEAPSGHLTHSPLRPSPPAFAEPVAFSGARWRDGTRPRGCGRCWDCGVLSRCGRLSGRALVQWLCLGRPG